MSTSESTDFSDFFVNPDSDFLVDNADFLTQDTDASQNFDNPSQNPYQFDDASYENFDNAYQNFDNDHIDAFHSAQASYTGNETLYNASQSFQVSALTKFLCVY
jgi:hypothetical protein